MADGKVRATITIEADTRDAQVASVSVLFDPPTNRENPTIVDYYAACALLAISQGSALAITLPTDVSLGVKRAAG